MSAITDLKLAIANYLHVAVGDLTVNTQDLGVLALNQVRKRTEMLRDFEFSRQLMTLTIDGLTGGSLDDAVIYGTDNTAEIKTLIEVGIFDELNNFRPVEWTTVAQSLEIQRQQIPGLLPRYPTDAQAVTQLCGYPRIVFSGSNAYLVPKCQNYTMNLGFEAYVFNTDWTIDSDDDTWLTKGGEYLMWASIVHINTYFEEFITRQEGNLPVPQSMADVALDAFIQWDTFKYEGFRRHN